jgi:hypothetical protein
MSLTRNQVHHQIFYYLLLLIIVTLPFAILINSFLIILFALNWILEGNFKKKIKSVVDNKLALAFIGFYFLHLIGLLYTNHLQSGLSDIETKLSLLVFPLILSSSAPLSGKQYRTILAGFAISCTFAVSICFAYALYQYFFFQTTTYFYYHDLSGIIGIHAVYLAMYVNFAIGIIIYFVNRYWRKLQQAHILLISLWIGVLFAAVLFLSSKTVILSVFIFANIFLVRLLYIKQGNKLGLVYALIINLLFIVLLYNIPYTRARFEDSIYSNLDFIKDKNYDIVHTGLSIRLTLLKFCADILHQEQAWLAGVGTGDGQAFLDSMYKKHQMYTGNIHLNDRGFLGYNAHNQYFQFLLSLGLLGLLYFIFLICSSTVMLSKQRNYLALFFLLSFCIAAVTESNLCTQKGVVYFAFFTSLFLFQSPSSLNQPVRAHKLKAN